MLPVSDEIEKAVKGRQVFRERPVEFKMHLVPRARDDYSLECRCPLLGPMVPSDG